jgi:g-D-glutamyl-meso-diaminopimelate peptidase
VQYVQKTMSLLAGTELYFKIGAKDSIATVAPQEIKVIASKGDWYQVSTQQGNGWIHPTPGVLAAVETIAKTADLKVKTTLYKYPDTFAPKVSFLNPQTVQVKGKWGDWLLASSGSGIWWINGKGIELKDPVVEKVEPSPEPTEAVTAPEQTPAPAEELPAPAATAAPIAP